MEEKICPERIEARKKARRAKIRELLQMANRSVDIFEQAIEQKKLS